MADDADLPQFEDPMGPDTEAVLDSFVERLRRGERPSTAEYAAADPARADEIRQWLEAAALLEGLGSGSSAPGDPGPATSDAGSIAVPPQLGEYRIIREISRGGMGIVFEAEQESLRRRVAVKVLMHHGFQDEKRFERFRRESQAAARLQHPHIVPVYGVGVDRGIHYYAMQYIDGVGLDVIIDDWRNKRSPGPRSGASFFRDAARIALQAAEALAYAHGEGILHRDIKPSNLIIDAEGTVWVTDFGLAKIDEGQGLTRTGDIVGTVAYMAPERFDDWADPRSDVYGLGLTLYEVATLRRAFQESDSSRLIRKVLDEDPPPPRKIDPRIPRDLETIILKAIDKEPGHRYASARDLADDLRRFLDDRSLRARREGPAHRLWRWCRRRPALASLAGIVLALIVAIAIGASAMALKQRALLRDSYLTQARANRRGDRVGRRFESLEALRRAAVIRPSLDLRNEAIAAMALVDLRLRPGPEWPSTVPPGFFEAGARRFVDVEEGTFDIRIRRTADFEEIVRLPGLGMHVVAIRFSPCGRYLAVKYNEEAKIVLGLWDLEDARLILKVPNGVSQIAFGFSPEGRRLAAGMPGGEIRFYDVPSGDVVKGVAWRGHPQDLAFRTAGRLIAVSDLSSQRVVLIDVATEKTIVELAHPARVFGLCWRDDGRLLAAACEDRCVRIWDVTRPGEPLFVLRGHDASVVRVAFRSDGLLASQGWDTASILWDADTGERILRSEHTGLPLGSPGPLIRTGGTSRPGLWEIVPPEGFLSTRGHVRWGQAPKGLSFDPSCTRLASTGGDGARIWDVRTGEEFSYLPFIGAQAAHFLPTGSALLTARTTGVHLWPIGDARPDPGPSRAILPETGFSAIHVSADANVDRRRCAISGSGPTYTFDLEEPSQRVRLDGHPGSGGVVLSRSGRYAATFGWRRAGVGIWDAESGRLLRILPVDNAEAAFSPDERWLVAGSWEEYTFWEIGTWAPGLRIPREDNSPAPSLDFTPDGKLLAIAITRWELALIDPAAGEEVARLEAPDRQPIVAIRFSADGRLLATGTDMYGVRIWDLRRIRAGLARLGLDWDAPPLPLPETPAREDTETPAGSPPAPGPILTNATFEGVAGIAEGDVRGAVPDFWHAFARIPSAIEIRTLPIPAGEIAPGGPAANALLLRLVASGGHAGVDRWQEHFDLRPGGTYRARFYAKSGNADGSAQAFRFHFPLHAGPPIPAGAYVKRHGDECEFVATGRWEVFVPRSLGITDPRIWSGNIGWSLVDDGGENALLIVEPRVEEVLLAPGPIDPDQVAVNGVATQSSTAWGGDASRAIDRITDGGFSLGSVTHTDPFDRAPWWEVDLGGVFDLDRIVLWNRDEDCAGCPQRLSNFRASVLGEGRDVTFEEKFFIDGRGFPPPRKPFEISLPRPTAGRFVRIELVGPNADGLKVLSLAEVQVFRAR